MRKILIAFLMMAATVATQADTVFSADFGTANSILTNNAVNPTTIASILNVGTSLGSWSGYQENFTQANAVGTIANAGGTDGGFEFRLTSGNAQTGKSGTIRADFAAPLDFSTDAATVSWDWYRVDNHASVRGELFAYDSDDNLVYGLQMRDGLYFETTDGVVFTSTGIACANTSTGFGPDGFNPSGLQSASLEFSPTGVLINGSVASALSLSYDEIAYVTCGIRAESGLKFGIIWDNLTADGVPAGSINTDTALYRAPEPLPFGTGGGMPGLVDGNDAFFTFSAVFGSFTFTPNTETNETGGVDGDDRMVLFESGGNGKGISLTLSDTGILGFRSGSSSVYQEALVDLPVSSLSTGTPVYVVAAFNATDNTIDLYLDSTTKTATASLSGNTLLAGTDGYGAGARANGLGAYDRATLDDYHFLPGMPDGDEYTNSTVMADNRMFDFAVYGTLDEALATIPQAGDLLTTFVGGPSEIYVGEPVTLSWVVDPAVDSITVSPAIDGETDMLTSNTAANGVGSIVAYPLSATTYQLIATLGANADTGTVEIVANPMEILDFSASATNVYAGESVTLSWNVPGAESISIDLDAENIVTTNATSGSVGVVQPFGSNTYVLTATNSFDSVTQEVTVIAEFAPMLTTIITANFTNGVYNSNGSFEYDAAGAELTAEYATPGLWLAGSSALGSANNQSVDNVIARYNAGVAHGTYALVIGGGAPNANPWSGGILNTEYAVQEGDSFEFSFWFDPVAGWDGSESLDVIVFTSSDDTLGGSLTAIMVTNINDGATAITKYAYTIPEIGVGSPHLGKKLWVEFSGVQANATLGAFARVDDVQLKAVGEFVATPAELHIAVDAGLITITASNLAPPVTYQAQWTDNLVFPDWADIGDPIFGTTSAMQDLPATNPAAFYRVISE